VFASDREEEGETIGLTTGIETRGTEGFDDVSPPPVDDEDEDEERGFSLSFEG